jgi:hypothetical protein
MYVQFWARSDSNKIAAQAIERLLKRFDPAALPPAVGPVGLSVSAIRNVPDNCVDELRSLADAHNATDPGHAITLEIVETLSTKGARATYQID